MTPASVHLLLPLIVLVEGELDPKVPRVQPNRDVCSCAENTWLTQAT
jgi:hypothetical protein